MFEFAGFILFIFLMCCFGCLVTIGVVFAFVSIWNLIRKKQNKQTRQNKQIISQKNFLLRLMCQNSILHNNSKKSL